MNAFLVRAKPLGFCMRSAVCFRSLRTWKPPLSDEEVAARDAARREKKKLKKVKEEV